MTTALFTSWYWPSIMLNAAPHLNKKNLQITFSGKEIDEWNSHEGPALLPVNTRYKRVLAKLEGSAGAVAWLWL
jgi:hypothetical protein